MGATQYAVQANATNIGGVQSQSINTGKEVRTETTSGSVYPDRAYMVAGRPAIAFTSKAVKQVLDAIPLLGVNIADLGAGFSAFAYLFDDGGTRLAAGRKYNMALGLLALGQLSCSHGADATITANATGKSDGVNDPVIESDAVSVPTGIENPEVFSLGPITIGGVSLTGVQSVEIGFGVEVKVESSDGNVYPTFTYIGTIAPIITIKGIDVQWLKEANIPRGGKAGVHADTTIYLRRRLAHSTYYANSSTEHIKFTVSGMAVIGPSFEAWRGEPGEVGMTLTCDFDGTNAPIKIATGQAIS